MGTFYGLVVEGVPGIGKSTLIDALIRRHVAVTPARKLRSLVHLAQTHTYGPLASREDAKTLTAAENRASRAYPDDPGTAARERSGSASSVMLRAR